MRDEIKQVPWLALSGLKLFSGCEYEPKEQCDALLRRGRYLGSRITSALRNVLYQGPKSGLSYLGFFQQSFDCCVSYLAGRGVDDVDDCIVVVGVVDIGSACFFLNGSGLEINTSWVMELSMVNTVGE